MAGCPGNGRAMRLASADILPRYQEPMVTSGMGKHGSILRWVKEMTTNLWVNQSLGGGTNLEGSHEDNKKWGKQMSRSVEPLTILTGGGDVHLSVT
nr:hypothetical protein BgiMline_011311 [Biomphalaria glabrata]